ncbi:hypothetical protein [Shewanella surugensis]|uniref:DUF2066 domain-containing protein n=1 Tax=Shewanella surugensis TaxID=212020 RepID=A0ABT0LIG1_9GAMM|nr:hypothetical protein [Shewanella surugensis]MCL1127501.1 hypothetical protein [Shewanella surugensis]
MLKHIKTTITSIAVGCLFTLALPISAFANDDIDQNLQRWLVQATIIPGSEDVLQERLYLANAADQQRRDDGIQEDLALVAADRSTAWIVLRAGSEETLQDIFATMPLNDYQTYIWTLIRNDPPINVANNDINQNLKRWFVQATRSDLGLQGRLHLPNPADQQLIADRIIEDLPYIAEDRSTAWIVLRAESEETLQDIIATTDYRTYSWTLILNEEEN